MKEKIILQKPKSTEKIIKVVEVENILVFETDRKSSKQQIKQEIEKLFDVKVDKVRTHIRKNKKLAYIKLKQEFPAIDVATKLGLI